MKRLRWTVTETCYSLKYVQRNIQVSEWRTWSRRPRLARHQSEAPKWHASSHEAETENKQKNQVSFFCFIMYFTVSTHAETHLYSLHTCFAEIPLHFNIYLSIPHITAKEVKTLETQTQYRQQKAFHSLLEFTADNWLIISRSVNEFTSYLM